LGHFLPNIACAPRGLHFQHDRRLGQNGGGRQRASNRATTQCGALQK